ncbi:efflux RND transporter periplasmic adaptor subunit [Sinorhizobium medicae]|uniref:Efflux transporter, RND family, MFP subunit n=1 Tax=Sinorhizobium medicae (strain WSM419) TaxID=366394 RepID=A6UFY2_SINMW|nr:efflux RND transporter periplasmic adaptor subunit [Sinorhizobium medicae]ABR62562.1 efflux transporter, RND family, MFP subunit [Sinorhizobium medicae WSM419]MDX0431870.1 efflux RND transporter periplasmic adaptor subunit [Sinorhizobium medicae]MDX0480721.1 efflux RND transporter periplasmic adaptor subunit [Sinorhizobium medicae]MDX0586086.1 efflux RND transporter periplasmic adaptor subunit [Sinorhizobium medicae]MDX0752313.1 efflux RND transporter periplasmic adaptor subunit [Sinorhizob
MRSKQQMRRYVVAVAAAAAVGAAAFWYALRPVPLSVVAPKRGDAAEIVYASGVVEPRVWAKVTSTVRERIVEQCNCEGERVETGDALARLDDTEAQAILGELQARLSLAQEEYRRKLALAERNTISEQTVDRARTDVAQLEALIAGQEARLAAYVLRAPSAGRVLRQDGEIGEVAELGTVLFWVGEPRPLIVEAEVNEEDIPRVEVGQKAYLRSDVFPERALEAVVDSITPKGDPVTKTYRVRLGLPEDTPLRIGMSTDVNIVVRLSRNALIIPAAAVSGTKVAVVKSRKAMLREIKTGIRGTNGVEVLSGLEESERIISPLPPDLADGTRVDVVRTEAK